MRGGLVVQELGLKQKGTNGQHMGVSKNGGTQQPWGFPTKNDHFGVFWGYPYFWKHPYVAQSLP